MRWGIGSVPRPGSRAATRPLLYLDIDGVLNPLAPADPDRLVEHAVDVLRFRVSALHGEWPAEPAGHDDLVWATLDVPGDPARPESIRPTGPPAATWTARVGGQRSSAAVRS